MASILKTEKNCWRVERADKLRFIIDAADYFRILRETLKNARKSIYLLCWDIDSRIELVRDEDNNGDGYPTRLGEFLDFLVKQRPDLEIYILDWDFAVLYTFDRELLPIYKLGWKTPPQIQFQLDSYHPEGASQHQKIVIVDETLAFIGGLDLTRGRWDTSDHVPANPRRDRIDKTIARPYHDVQVMLDGAAAAALAELVRDRWQKATGQELPRVSVEKPRDPWPQDVAPDMEGVLVGLSRTQAAYKQQKAIREVEAFYKDAILSARDHIYIENQFFTAPSIGEALQACLEKPDAPEVVVVTPRETDGWLPQHTMDVLRIRLFRKLQRHDPHNRLRVFYPDAPGLEESPINVHAKVMIVDDRLVTAGSANLNNRSMGLDNECNMIVEAASDPSVATRITAFRNQLLAEHLGCAPDDFQKVVERRQSLIGGIEEVNDTGKRHLKPLPLEISPRLDRLVPDTELLDPEHPIRPELMIRHMAPATDQQPARFRMLAWILLIAVIAGVSVMWRYTPLSQWVDVDTLSGMIQTVRGLPAAPVWVVAGFVLAGLVAFPFSLLIVATVVAFGPVAGFLYSLTGGMFSAVIMYWVGDLLGRNFIRKLAGSTINRISQKLARHGVINIVFVRIVPVAPFTIINLAAGASHIHFRDYCLGTVLGMVPGMLAMTILADRVQATIQKPETGNVVWLVITAVLVAGAAGVLVKWVKGRTGEKTGETAAAD